MCVCLPQFLVQRKRSFETQILIAVAQISQFCNAYRRNHQKTTHLRVEIGWWARGATATQSKTSHDRAAKHTDNQVSVLHTTESLHIRNRDTHNHMSTISRSTASFCMLQVDFRVNECQRRWHTRFSLGQEPLREILMEPFASKKPAKKKNAKSQQPKTT